MEPENKFSNRRLPLNYRVSGSYWISLTISLLITVLIPILANIGFERFVVPLILICLTGVWGVVLGISYNLLVSDEGFVFSTPFSSQEIFWQKIERIEVKHFIRIYNLYGNSYQHLFFHISNKNDPVVIDLAWMPRNNFNEFISILKAKAPQSILDPKIVKPAHFRY